MEGYKRFGAYNSGFITNKIKSLEPVDKPVTDVNKEEAARVQLTILSRSTDPNKSLYLFNSCRHTEFIQPTHVRRNNFKCSTCQHLKEVQDASAAGFTLLFKSKGTHRRCIKSCGCIADVTMQRIQKDKGKKCQKCFDASLLETAESREYEIIENLGQGRHLMRFKSCGHTKEIHQTQVFKGNAVCRDCILEEHISQAKQQGLRYISNIKDRYNLYKLPCGHEKELRQDHAQDGVWTCSECGDSYYNKPSNVYLVKFTHKDFSWLKLGFAKNLTVRINNYGLSPDVRKEILAVVEFNRGYDAMLLEKSLHRKYSTYRLSKKQMLEYHKANGFTECYPTSIAAELLYELQGKNFVKD